MDSPFVTTRLLSYDVDTTESPQAKAYVISGGRIGHLPALTGLRFVAALWVVLFHLCTFWRPGIMPLPSQQGPLRGAAIAVLNLIGNGYLGVNVFFVLSGFILTYTYQTLGGWSSRGRWAFYMARFARIYPLYLCALIIAPLLWAHRDPVISEAVPIVSTLTLTATWLPHPNISWCGAGWSLCDEAFFYLLFPLVATLTASLSRQRIYVLLCLSWIASLLAPLTYLLYNPDRLRDIWHATDAPWLAILHFNPLARFPEFLLGVALARLFIMNRAIPSAHGVNYAGRRVVLSVVSIVALCGISPILPSPLLYNGLLDPAFALLIYNLALNMGRGAWFCSLPMVTLLGEASYALYLLHTPLWVWLTRIMGLPSDSVTNDPINVPLCAAYLCLVVAIALLSLRFVEQPARRTIRRRARL